MKKYKGFVALAVFVVLLQGTQKAFCENPKPIEQAIQYVISFFA